ncbi:winged helix domain-containing protein [Neisseria yangbaofengii]|uniref:winged helix domain-containing protein n=1 Tax=Neisseria yangbaofengii TaxID=2709396 RepID=UPI0013EE03EA|nr:winged helix domain-containing protein [Neisseria yangbaofengii]
MGIDPTYTCRWHNPVPMGCETFHLAIGTFPPNGHNYMEWLMNKVPAIVGFRHNLQGWEHDKSRLKTAAEEFAAQIADPDNYEAFMQEFLGEQRTDSRFAFEIFGNPHSDGLPEDALLSLNTVDASTLEKGYLIANGIKLNIDDSSILLLKAIQQAGVINIKQFFQSQGGDKLKLTETINHLIRLDILEIKMG